MSGIKRAGTALAAAALLSALGGQASAASIVVLNSSFELPVLSPSGFTTSVPDWSCSSCGVYRPVVGTEVVAVPNGNQVAYEFSGSTLFQDLGVAVQSGLIYQLDVFVGPQINFNAISYVVELLAGGSTVIASSSGSLPQSSPFIPVSISGAGAGSGNLGVRLTATGGQPLFDDVRVQSIDSVPEPGTFSALALGLAAAAWRRSRRR